MADHPCTRCGGDDHRHVGGLTCPHLVLSDPVSWRTLPYVLSDLLWQSCAPLTDRQIQKRFRLFPTIAEFAAPPPTAAVLSHSDLAPFLRSVRPSSRELLRVGSEKRHAEALRLCSEREAKKTKQKEDAEGRVFGAADFVTCSSAGASREGLLHRPDPGTDPWPLLGTRCEYIGCIGVYCFEWEADTDLSGGDQGAARMRRRGT